MTLGVARSCSRGIETNNRCQTAYYASNARSARSRAQPNESVANSIFDPVAEQIAECLTQMELTAASASVSGSGVARLAGKWRT